MYLKPKQKWVQILAHKYLHSQHRKIILSIHDPPKGSTIWNFLVSCRKVIIDHMTWQLGNGEKVDFWKDSWDGRSTLSLRAEVEAIKQVAEQHWGLKVCDYMENSRRNGGGSRMLGHFLCLLIS